MKTKYVENLHLRRKHASSDNFICRNDERNFISACIIFWSQLQESLCCCRLSIWTSTAKNWGIYVFSFIRELKMKLRASLIPDRKLDNFFHSLSLLPNYFFGLNVLNHGFRSQWDLYVSVILRQQHNLIKARDIIYNSHYITKHEHHTQSWIFTTSDNIYLQLVWTKCFLVNNDGTLEIYITSHHYKHIPIIDFSINLLSLAAGKPKFSHEMSQFWKSWILCHDIEMIKTWLIFCG